MKESAIKQVLTDTLLEIVKASTHKYLRRYKVGKKWRYVYPDKTAQGRVSRHSEDAKVSRSKILTGSFQPGESFAVGKNQGHLQITKVDGENVSFRRDDSDLELSMHKKDLESFLEQAFDGLFLETGNPATKVEAKAISVGVKQSLRQLTGKSLEKMGEVAQSPARAIAKISGIDTSKYDAIDDPYERSEALVSDTVGAIDKITKGIKTITSPIAYKALVGVAGGAVASVGVPGGLAAIAGLFATGLAMKVAYIATKYSIKTMHELAVHGGEALKNAGKELKKALTDKLSMFLSAVSAFGPEELDAIFANKAKAYYLDQFSSLRAGGAV